MSNNNCEYVDKSSKNEVNYEINSWEELEVSQDLLRGIYANGFENPSPIQRKAIVPMLKNTMLLHKHNQEQVKLVVLP